MRHLGLRIEDDVLEKLDARAEEMGASRSELIRAAIRDFMGEEGEDKLKYFAAIYRAGTIDRNYEEIDKLWAAIHELRSRLQ